MMGPSTDLLTASESNAFSSFLSAMDSFDPSTAGLGLSPEWNMYQQQQQHHHHQHHHHHHGGVAVGGYSGGGSSYGGKEDLARATKDLISISFGGEERFDGLTRNSGSLVGSSQMRYGGDIHQQRHPVSTTYIASNGQLTAMVGPNGGDLQPNHPYLQVVPHNNASWPNIPDPGPSSARGASFDSAEQRIAIVGPSSRTSMPHNGGGDRRPPLATLSLGFPQGSTGGRSSSSSTTPRSLATPVSASSSRKRTSLDLRLDLNNVNTVESDLFSNKRLRFSPAAAVQTVNATVSLSPNDSKPAGPSAPTNVSRKHSTSASRPSHHKSGSSSSRSKSISSASDHQAPLQQQKHAPASISSAASSSSSVTVQGPGSPSSVSASSKPPQLLSNSQKKLNHIHSEQKRRANIRRGYDSLCDVVPALRDAIIAEDKECERTGRKRGRGRLLGDDGEKLDGRAGPRSESVVLQKTIEYMAELLDTRSSLLDRLAMARAALPPHHPALALTGHGDTEPRPWERIWDGGIGLPAGGLGDGADGEGDDGSEGEWDGDDGE
ncbi:hypothetical protein FRB94_000276 [Tulasnella sp. JGI-2019a]|nr:hypothetical protein FRB94_000276 [Tulasnella sp. JGI-2019a]